MWSMLQSTIDHATERIIAHGPARRTYAYQSPQTRINDYTPTHLTARVHPNLCSPPNPCTQQTRSTNTRNKLTQPVVLFYPIHPNSLPAEPTCFRVLFAPAEALAEGSKISLAGRQVHKPRCLSPGRHCCRAWLAADLRSKLGLTTMMLLCKMMMLCV